MTRFEHRLSWLLQVAVAIILLQTLFFKFTAAEESVYIFTALGAEPSGRIAPGSKSCGWMSGGGRAFL